MKTNLGDALLHQVFPVTDVLALGKYATESRAEYLREEGYTHILNVSDAPNVVSPAAHGFDEVGHIPLLDVACIADEDATACLDALHRMTAQQGSRVYVHCIAGQVRSPTIVWLYLVACGMETDDARALIACRALDSAPGHPKLVDGRLVALVQERGREKYLPHPRPDTLQAVEI